MKFSGAVHRGDRLSIRAERNRDNLRGLRPSPAPALDNPIKESDSSFFIGDGYQPALRTQSDCDRIHRRNYLSYLLELRLHLINADNPIPPCEGQVSRRSSNVEEPRRAISIDFCNRMGFTIGDGQSVLMPLRFSDKKPRVLSRAEYPPAFLHQHGPTSCERI